MPYCHYIKAKRLFGSFLVQLYFARRRYIGLQIFLRLLDNLELFEIFVRNYLHSQIVKPDILHIF
jgi:hypothetical protein